jgi:phospholipid/cholesterol/gamma-HCH transport system substrate-binding protein
MSPAKRNLITGIVVLGAIGTLLWMILTFSGRAMGIFQATGMKIAFTCDRADGLSDGSPVFYAGIEVGKVTSVRLENDGVHVLIDGEIYHGVPLPKNVVGEIKSQSSLGTSTQISLRLNGKPEGLLTADAKPIALRYTGAGLIPPEITDFIESANRQKLVEHVDGAIISLREQAEKAGKLIDSTQLLVADPKMQEDLRKTLSNIRLVTDRANKIGDKIESLTDNANSAIGEVRTTVADANKIITKTDKNVDQIARQIGSDLDKLGQTFQQFQDISEKINKGHGTAGALVNDPKLYDELTDSAKELKVVASSLERLVDQWEHEGLSVNLGKK